MGGLTPKVVVEKIEVPRIDVSLETFHPRFVPEPFRLSQATEKIGEGFSTNAMKDSPMVTVTPNLFRNSGVKYLNLASKSPDRAGPDPARMILTTRIDPRHGVGADLVTLNFAKPTLVGTIEELTSEWESIFEKGGKILQSGTRYFLSGDFGLIKPPVTEKEFKIYQAWVKALKLDPVEPHIAQTELDSWTSFLQERGVHLSYEGRMGPKDVSLLAGQDRDFFFFVCGPLLATLSSLTQLLPANVFSGETLREIRLNSPHTDKNQESSSLDQKILTLFPEALRGSRRNLAAQILFQVGRSTAIRFENTDVFKAMYVLLNRRESLFALDWGEGYEDRLARQKESFQNFMGDLVLAYVAAGPKLRDFIDSLGDTSEGQAWAVLYDRVRRDLFEGKEYDYFEETGALPNDNADRYLDYLIPEEGEGIRSDYFKTFFVNNQEEAVKALEEKRILQGLEEKKNKLFETLRALGEVEGSARVYPTEVLLNDVEKVLERAYPLTTISEGKTDETNARLLVDEYMTAFVQWSKELYPEVWEKTQGRNLFDGEKIYKKNEKGDMVSVPDAEYRFARMLHNVKAGKPPLGELSQEEKDQVVNFVSRALKVSVSSYEEAQKVLRDQMILLTPKVQKALKAADLSLRTTLLDSFFGSSLETELPDLSRAYSLAKFFGQIGFYREIGLSVDLSTSPPRVFLTLGDLNRVTTAPNRFGILHTHSLVFTNRRKKVMGWQGTLAPEFGKELRATGLVIFSDKDIASMVREAKRLVRKGVAVPFLYHPATNLYRNWVQHPYGASFLKMELSPEGEIKTISVEYALYEKEGLDHSHATEAQKLKSYLQTSFPGAEVRLERVKMEELEREAKK